MIEISDISPDEDGLEFELTDYKVAKKLVALNKSGRSRGYEVNLSFKKLKQLMSRKTCEITGRKFVLNNPDDPDYPSIDRLDNNRGYVDDNIVICTSKINRQKGDLSIEDIKNIHALMSKRQLL